MLLTAKYVIPITSPFISNGAVLVRDDEIVDVGETSFLKAKYPNEEVKDLGLSAIMPGFVDIHTHLGYTALRGMFDDIPYAEWKREVLRREVFFDKADWDASARLGALEAVASGITTIADITSTGSSFTAASEMGLRARIYREVMTTHGDHVGAVIEEGLGDIERWRDQDSTSRINFGIAPGPIYACHPEVFKEIARYACETGIPVAMHLAGSYEEEDFIRYGSSPFSVRTSESEHHLTDVVYPPWLPAGCSPVQYVLNWDILDVPDMLAIHCVHVDDKDIATLASHDVAAAYCPRINSKLSMGSAPLIKFFGAGMRVGFGTDSPAAVSTMDMIDEMRLGLMLTRATSPDRRIPIKSSYALRMATIEGARCLNMDDRIGSLEPGKKADIIAIDLHNSHQNPTNDPEGAVIYTANQDNVKMTMIDGKVLYDDFTHVSGVDRDGIVSTATALRERVRASVDNEDLRAELMQKSSEDRRERYDR